MKGENRHDDLRRTSLSSGWVFTTKQDQQNKSSSATQCFVKPSRCSRLRKRKKNKQQEKKQKKPRADYNGSGNEEARKPARCPSSLIRSSSPQSQYIVHTIHIWSSHNCRLIRSLPYSSKTRLGSRFGNTPPPSPRNMASFLLLKRNATAGQSAPGPCLPPARGLSGRINVCSPTEQPATHLKHVICRECDVLPWQPSI